MVAVAGVGVRRIFLTVFGAGVVVLVGVATGWGIGGGDAVVEPAITLAAARGGGGFRTRSTTACAAAIAITSIGSSRAIDCALPVLVAGMVVVVGVVDTGEAAPSPSDTLALDCRVADDVGGVV